MQSELSYATAEATIRFANANVHVVGDVKVIKKKKHSNMLQFL